jgi:hypothetical protein
MLIPGPQTSHHTDYEKSFSPNDSCLPPVHSRGLYCENIWPSSYEGREAAGHFTNNTPNYVSLYCKKAQKNSCFSSCFFLAYMSLATISQNLFRVQTTESVQHNEKSLIIITIEHVEWVELTQPMTSLDIDSSRPRPTGFAFA